MSELNIHEMHTWIGKIVWTHWRDVPQSQIDEFADCTDDHQSIHVDTDYARISPFGGTIAHGFLLVSLIPALLADSAFPVAADMKLEINYGCDKIRFLNPVRSGKRIRGRFVLQSIEERQPGRWQRMVDCQVEIEGEDKPALVASWITQIIV